MRIVEHLHNHNVESARELARELDRDKGNVSRDLKFLAKYGVVGFDTTGRAKRHTSSTTASWSSRSTNWLRSFLSRAATFSRVREHM
ncbi:HVO_A0114 family putative DNA-binding protein [Halarchaeum acidiphilum]